MPSAYRFRLRVLGVLSLGGAIVLSGCQGEPAGEQPTRPATSASSSAPLSTPSAVTSDSPEPSAGGTNPAPEPTPASSNGPAANIPVPTKPALADQNSKEGLEAFTRYWFELFNYGYATNDWTEFDSVTDPACASCQRIRSVVGGIYQDGRWLRGGEFEILEFSTEFQLNASGSVQSFVYNQQRPITYFEADGTELRTDPPPPPAMDVTFALHVDNQWFMLDYGHPEGT
ncbi:DUF6318 family protein [Arthrobacter sp. TMN-37]